MYARFLGIDPESAVTDLNDELGSSSAKLFRKPLGTIASQDSKEGQREVVASKSTNKINLSRNKFPSTYVVLAVSSLALILFVVVLLTISISSEPDSLEPEGVFQKSLTVKESLPQTLPQSSVHDQLPEPIASELLLELAAKGPISRLIICDEGKTPKQFHEFKNIETGWEKTIPFTSSFRCYSSSLENIRFAVDGGLEKQVSGEGAGNFRWSPQKN